MATVGHCRDLVIPECSVGSLGFAKARCSCLTPRKDNGDSYHPAPWLICILPTSMFGTDLQDDTAVARMSIVIARIGTTETRMSLRSSGLCLLGPILMPREKLLGRLTRGKLKWENLAISMLIWREPFLVCLDCR
jgi:hypothetical protein